MIRCCHIFSTHAPKCSAPASWPRTSCGDVDSAVLEKVAGDAEITVLSKWELEPRTVNRLRPSE